MADKFEEIEARVLHPEQGHVHLLRHSRDLVMVDSRTFGVDVECAPRTLFTVCNWKAQ
jgi:hypothetical protein